MARHAGIVIYNRNDLIINRSYAQWLQEEAANQDIGLHIIERESIGVHVGKEDGLTVEAIGIGRRPERPDFVINRSRDVNLTRLFELSGIRVFNNSQITDLGNRKELAYAHAKKCGVPILPFELHHQCMDRSYEVDRIIKTPAGHGGNEVYYGKDYISGAVFTTSDGSRLSPSDDFVLSQDFCNGLRGDLRVYIMDNRPYAAVLRRTPEGSYLSNFTKGATIGYFEIEKTPVATYVETLLKDVHADYCGIDFLCDDSGNFYFNEIEDAVGSRMLSQLGGGYNTAGDLMRHIRSWL